MKVYIVTSGEYSDYGIDAVFTNEEAALKFCAMKNENNWSTYDVEEWDSDVENVQCEKEVNMIWYTVVGIQGNGKHTEIRRPYGTLSFDTRNEIIKQDKRLDIYVTTKPDVAVEKVKRIIYDRFAHWKYENEC